MALLMLLALENRGSAVATLKLGHPVIAVRGRFANARLRASLAEPRFAAKDVFKPPPLKPVIKGEQVHARFLGRFAGLRGKQPFRSRLATKENCPCEANKWADRLWVNLMVKHDVWRKWLKAPHMSPYDLWMKECTECFRRGHYAPLEPSISGGFSRRKVIPHYLFQPPRSCIPNYLIEWFVELGDIIGRERYVHFLATYRDRRYPRYSVHKIEVWHYGNGWTQTATDYWSSTKAHIDWWNRIKWPSRLFWRIRTMIEDGTFQEYLAEGTNKPFASMPGSIPLDKWQHKGPWK